MIEVLLIAFMLGYVLDAATSGWVRAELGGGVSGAVRGTGREWLGRRARTHKRRQKARAKTRAGRAVNAYRTRARPTSEAVATAGPRAGATRTPEDKSAGLRIRPGGGESSGRATPNEEPEQTPVEEPERSGDEPEQTVKAEPEQAETEPRAEPEQTPEQAPNGTPTGAADSTERGTNTVGDLTSAQAVIAAWEEIRGRIEQIKADLKQVSGDASGLADGAGEFKVGTEDDGVKALDNAVAWLGSADERVAAVVASIHDDFDSSIEASEGKHAEVHRAFQGS
jgi:hypothetical protein